MEALVAESADAWAQVITESFVPLSLGSVSGSFRGPVRSNALGPAVTLTAVRVLAACVRELASTREGLTGDLRAELGATVADLLATALRAVAGEGPGVPSGRTALLTAMRAYVRGHLADPRLPPGALARRHGVSLRYTADLFAADGTSPAAFIRAGRSANPPFHDDPLGNLASLRAMLALRPAALYVGHGGRLDPDRVARWAAKEQRRLDRRTARGGLPRDD